MHCSAHCLLCWFFIPVYNEFPKLILLINKLEHEEKNLINQSFEEMNRTKTEIIGANLISKGTSEQLYTLENFLSAKALIKW